MLPRILIVTVLSLSSVFAKSFDDSDVEIAGNLFAQSFRPTLVLSYEMQAIDDVFGGESNRSPAIGLLKNHAGQVELAASYHRVTLDTTKNQELLKLANDLYLLRHEESQICSDLVEPNSANDAMVLLGKLAYIESSSDNRQEREQLQSDAFVKGMMSHLGAQIKLGVDATRILRIEKECYEVLMAFLSAHPELNDSKVFNSPLLNLYNEHLKRGEELASKLKNDPEILVNSLLGLTSEKLNWRFDQADKIISVKINNQKKFGICVVSDVTIVSRGFISGKKTLNFKVAHQVNRLGGISVIALN